MTIGLSSEWTYQEFCAMTRLIESPLNGCYLSFRAGLASLGKRVLWVLAVAALFVVVQPARAQFGMMNNAQMMQDTITRRGLDRYCKLLGLDKDQKDAAKALFEGQQTETATLQKETAEKMKELGEKARENSDFSVYQTEMPAMMKAMAEKGEKLEESFFADLKALCNDEQLANWDTVTRFRRREKAMRFGFVSGSAVDMIAVTEKVKPATESVSDLKDTLLQYELEVDKLLVEFERVGKESQKDMFEGGAMFDMTKIESMMRKFYDAGALVRDVNRKYERQIAPLLSEEERTKLDLEVKRRSHPKIYKASRPQQLFDAAMGLADLTAEQREQLVVLREGYNREASPINERWAKAAEEKEEKAGGTVMVMIQGFQMQGGGADDPVKTARESRKEVDDKTKDRIEAVLTKEQVAKLPAKKTEEFNPMADFMFSDDEGEEGATESK